jgi:hypothetical protein
MSVTTANRTEKMGQMERYTNGHTNGHTIGDTHDEQAIVTEIPQEPVTIKRKPWIPPKDSKLLNPGA